MKKKKRQRSLSPFPPRPYGQSNYTKKNTDREEKT